MCKGEHQYGVVLEVKSLWHNVPAKPYTQYHCNWISARRGIKAYVAPKRIKLNRWYATKGGNRAKITRSCKPTV